MQGTEVASERLDAIEKKLDACLVLLKIAVTHDGFSYTLTNKSDLWINAIRNARKVATDASVTVAETRPGHAADRSSSSSHLECTSPTETVGGLEIVNS
jgi:hypothetical protein